MEDVTQLSMQLEQLRGIVAQGQTLARTIARTQKEAVQNISELKETLEKKLGNGFAAADFLSFFKKPYVTIPQGRNKVIVAVPKFVKGFQVGWLWKETDTFFLYELDQYSAWLGDVPSDLLAEIDFKPEFNATIEGNRITFDRGQRDIIKKRLGHMISEGTLTDTEAVVKKGYAFDIIAEIIKNGCLPFRANPVASNDLRKPRGDILLRSYQQRVENEFLKKGAVGAFEPTGAGKSFISMHIMDIITGPKLLFVPNNTLKEQWFRYIEAHIPHVAKELQIHTYATRQKFDQQYMLTIFDECHRLPADTFSRLALIKTKYRLGLSASPHREDGREHYIFALTGFPVGINWPEYMATVGKSYHPIVVHIMNSSAAKLRKLDELFNPRKRTFIFCDSIQLGKEISRRHNIPYIHGETADRMRIIEENRAVAISRVGDEGVSVKDLERVIEVDFHGASRRQELQRTGRLMHSEEAERHDIIMTEGEMRDYGQRIWALQEKGFSVKIAS